MFPRSAKDLTIAAQNAHALCYDNMRNFRSDMSDILCMAATGGAISNRALYTDADQHIHHLHVALVLNGIHSFINQADLAQRCLSIRTLTMDEANRKTEAAMVKALEDGTLYNMSGLPIPRLGRPEDIAHLALFLSSDLAGYITGQLISVSGGVWSGQAGICRSRDTRASSRG